MTKRREYRFVSKVLTTRWKPIPKSGIIRPTKLQRMQMGEFDLELRGGDGEEARKS